MSCFRTLLRLLLMRSHASKVPTSLTPLINIRSVVIFVDCRDEHCEPAKVKMSRFFESFGLKVKIICAEDKDIRTSSDMFLAVNYSSCISERYAAISSTARFKIGRHQLRGDIYNFVFEDPADAPMKVDAFFDAIKQYFTMIK